MNKLYVYLLSCVLISPSFINAQVFKSDFGFISEISENWLPVTRETVSKNPDVLNFDNSELKTMDSSLISQIKKMALAGKIELLYYKKSGSSFYDNINLFIVQKSLSSVTKYTKDICQSLPSQIKQAYNRENNTNVYYCKSEKIHRLEMVVSSMDGAIVGTKSYGYYFNTNNNIINLTVTCINSKCKEVKKDAELMFKYIKLD